MASMNFAWSSAVRAEPGEPLACWLDKHARVQGGGRESPGMRVTFFCFAKRKSPKKRRPPVCDPFAERRGTPAAWRLRGAPQNSLRAGALRSNNCGESVHEAWALRRPCSPRNRPAAGAASRGGTAEHPNSRTAIRAIAALGLACAARGACAREFGPSAAKARVDVLSPLAPLDAPRSAGFGGSGLACV